MTQGTNLVIDHLVTNVSSKPMTCSLAREGHPRLKIHTIPLLFLLCRTKSSAFVFPFQSKAKFVSSTAAIVSTYYPSELLRSKLDRCQHLPQLGLRQYSKDTSTACSQVNNR